MMTAIAIAVCALSIVALGTLLVTRRLPIYALDWRDAERIEIADIGATWKVALTDPQEIAILAKYAEAGHYQSMLKCASCFHLVVTCRSQATEYYVHGSALGPLPGGMAQTIFVPRREGLLADIRDLLARHGRAECPS